MRWTEKEAPHDHSTARRRRYVGPHPIPGCATLRFELWARGTSIAAMHTMFEVFLVPGSTGEGLLSQETLDDTLAQVMTREQAEAVGFSGIPDADDDRLFIVVAKRDEKRIMNALEASNQVGRFAVHPVDIDL